MRRSLSVLAAVSALLLADDTQLASASDRSRSATVAPLGDVLFRNLMQGRLLR